MKNQNREKSWTKVMNLFASIQQFIQENDYPPTIREMQEMETISTTSLVKHYLDRLEEHGYIDRVPNKSRSLRVLKPAHKKYQGAVLASRPAMQNLLSIPIIGRIFASQPVPVPPSDFDYFTSEDTVEIAGSMLPVKHNQLEQLYALQVKGNSMIEDMVNDGDILIMQSAQEASNGDMVAIWLSDEDETTLKRFYREKDRIRLQPANPEMKPIYIDDKRSIRVQGKVLLIVKPVSNPKFIQV